MRVKDINLHSISNIIIYFLCAVLLILTIHTCFILVKLNKLKSIPKNSINVSPKVEESFKPTFNKNINYLGSDYTEF